MAEALKVLGQSNPAATTLTALYTVPAATSVTASTLVVCNRTGGSLTFRVSVAPLGASDSLEQYLYYDTKILKNDSIFATIGLTLAATDVVRVYASALGLSFSLFGVEVT
jgi:hypothetical protein